MTEPHEAIIRMGDECFRMNHKAEIEQLRFDLKVTRSELGKADQENNAAGARARTAEAEQDVLRAEFVEMTDLHDAKHRDWQRSEAAIERVESYLAGIEAHCSANRMDVPSWVGSVRAALRGAHGPAPAPTLMSAATEARGGAGETEEGRDER